MKTRLTPTADGATVVLDQAILEAAGIKPDAEVEVSAYRGIIVITPLRDPDRQRRFEEAMAEVDERYGDLFRRLADS